VPDRAQDRPADQDQDQGRDQDQDQGRNQDQDQDGAQNQGRDQDQDRAQDQDQDRDRNPGKPLRADARRNRDNVLRAAREAFAAAGYGVPLDEIAARAGVGPGTVYRHFPTKEALFEAVVSVRLEDLVEDARRCALVADPEAAFFGFMARIADEGMAKRDLPDAIVAPGRLRNDLRAALGSLLRRAQEAGAVRDGITTEDLIALLKGLFAGAKDDPDPARYHRLLAVVMDGLRARR
jgi:AcrR family transcriptional regulator